VRRSVEAATDQAIAAVWSERDTRVTLAGQVADTYLGLRSLQQQLAVAEAERARQQELLAMIQARARAGFTTELDVAQQQTLVDSSAAPLPGLAAEIRARIHALGVLVGDAPDALAGELAAPAALPPVPPQIPVGLPSDLLRRRPDLRAAERQLAAATAEIGAATAELYPSISLTGAFSFVSTALKNLLSLSSRQYSGDAALRWPLLDGGRIRANIAVTKEQRAQAALTYRKTVLAALRDVEDALGFYAGEQQRNRALRRARDSGRSAVAVTQRQYQAGLADFSNVLNAQAALLNAENQLAQSDGAIDHDLVVLYEALGGGWVAGETGLVEEAGAVE
jgi:outer membrane protein, multidrug efflux system